VLYRPPRKAWLMELVTHARRRPGLSTAPTSMAGVKQLIKALKGGECVGLLPDQVPPAGQGVWSPFFGRNAYTMTLAVRLALQTKAIILVAWGERLAMGKGYIVHVSPLHTPARGDLPADLEGALRQVNAAMEDLIRTCPAQYLWGYARYKQPKVEG
jgi:Kdo2-lipid IVA lauroyltransferase/acyltransferase